MEEKVDSLILFLKKFINTSNYDLLKNKFNDACYCLKSQDLIGLEIIKIEIEKHKKTNTQLDKDLEEILRLVNEVELEYRKDIIEVNEAEELFLNLSYNKFFDISKEIYSKEFWEKDSNYRLNQISRAFSIYTEILNHKPFKGVLKWIERNRPPMESEISGPLFKFIRNVLAHFPFFDNWDEIWISKELVNWNKPNQSIDKFLIQFCGKEKVKYRFKENSKSEFTFVTINFPEKYDNEKIFLKDIIPEEEGIKFALVMMFKVLNTQIESIN